MQNIYVHIGNPKTATTSLQRFFYNNKQVLEQVYNIYYPSSPGLENHLKLAAYASPGTTKDMIRGQLQDKENRDSFKADFQQEINEALAQQKDILLSNEHLASRLRDLETIDNFVSLFEGMDVKICVVVYLRRQDKFMVSSYSTWIKSGGAGDFDYKTFVKPRFNYKKQLDRWENCAGIDQIVVRPFETDQFVGGSIYQDFINAIGKDWHSDLTIPEDITNPSLDRVQLKFLSLVNKELAGYDDIDHHTFRLGIVRMLEQFASKDKISLTEEEQSSIIKHYAKLNEEISVKYNGGKAIFSDHIKDNLESKAPELTVDEAVKIAVNILISMQDQINELKDKKEAKD